MFVLVGNGVMTVPGVGGRSLPTVETGDIGVLLATGMGGSRLRMEAVAVASRVSAFGGDARGVSAGVVASRISMDGPFVCVRFVSFSIATQSGTGAGAVRAPTGGVESRGLGEPQELRTPKLLVSVTSAIPTVLTFIYKPARYPKNSTAHMVSKMAT